MEGRTCIEAKLFHEVKDVVSTAHFNQGGSKTPNFTNLEALLSQAPDSLLQTIHLPVLQPLAIIFFKCPEMPEKQLLSYYACLEKMLAVKPLKSFEVFETILNGVCQKLSNYKVEKLCSPDEVVCQSSELFTSLFICVDKNIFKKFVTHDNLTSFGMIISALVKHFSISSTKVQLALLKSLKTVLTIQENKEALSSILSSFFPGILAAILKLLKRDDQNSSVLCQGVFCLESFLSLTLKNYFIERETSNDGKWICSNDVNKRLLAKRDEAWLKKVRDNLNLFFGDIVDKMSLHSNLKVRFACQSFCYHVTLECSRTLGGCETVLIKNLVAMTVDENEEISALSNIHLTNLSNKGLLTPEIQLGFANDALRDLSHLAKKFVILSDNKIGQCLTNILGSLKYIDCFSIFAASAVISKAFEDIYQCYIPEIQNVMLIQSSNEHVVTSENEKVISNFTSDSKRLAFRGLNQSSEEKLGKVIALMVTEKNSLSCVETIDSHLNLYPHLKPSILAVLCQILPNLKISDQFPSDYVSSFFEDVFLDNFADSKNSETRNGILETVMLLKSCQEMSSLLMGKFNTRKFLYRITALSSSSISIVSSTAIETLIYLGKTSLSCQSITEVFQQNSDYIFSEGLIKLTHFSLYPEITDVLATALSFCPGDFVLYIKDIVEEIERQLKFLYRNETLTEKLFFLLSSVAKFVRRKYVSDDEMGNICLRDAPEELWTSPPENQDLVGTLKSFISAVRENKRRENEATHESENPNEEISEEPSYEEKKEPVDVEICSRILKQCVQFSRNPNIKTRIYCLEAAESCFLALNEEPKDGNYLLPMIHSFWGPLKELNADEKSIVVLRSCKLIVTLAFISQDFVRKRIQDDVLPKLLTWFENLKKVSFEARTNSYLRTTNDFKLLLLLIKTVPRLLTNCKVIPWDRKTTFEVCKNYIHFSNETLNCPEIVVEANSALQYLTLFDKPMIYVLSAKVKP